VEPQPGMGLADIALSEIIEEKVGWEMAAAEEAPVAPAPRRRRSKAAA
jgi:hypothetical protein